MFKRKSLESRIEALEKEVFNKDSGSTLSMIMPMVLSLISSSSALDLERFHDLDKRILILEKKSECKCSSEFK